MKRIYAFILCCSLFFQSSFIPATAQTTVTTGTGSSLLSPSSSEITTMQPTHWTEGSIVTILGNGFGSEIPSSGQLCFSTTTCTTPTDFLRIVTSWSPNKIELQIPKANIPPQGNLELLLPTSTGQLQWLSVGSYTFTSRIPVLTSVDVPSTVKPEITRITVKGNHFGSFTEERIQVCFNNICLQPNSLSRYIHTWNDTTFQFSIPAFTKGTEVKVRVFIELYREVQTNSPIVHELTLPTIAYTPSAPIRIDEVSPTTHLIPGSSTIRIKGIGFGDQFIETLHRICFDDFCLPTGTENEYIISWTDTEIRFRLPDALSTLEQPLLHLHIYDHTTQTYQQIYAPEHFILSEMPRISRYYPIMETGLTYSLEGHGFGKDQGSVRLGKQDLPIVSWSTERVEFRIPNNAQTGVIRITTKQGYESNALSVQIRVVPRSTNDPFSHYQWYIDALGVQDAWQTSKGSSEIIVAVIDSAVDTSHEDLKDALWQNPKEIPGNGIDDDNNGYADDVYGWDFVRNSPSLRPLNPHGTQVASVIAAGSDNMIGISGLAPNVRIMSLDITTREADGSTSVDVDAVQEAILYAVDNGASVINLSFGGITTVPVYAEVLQYAYDHNVVVIAAAGNMRLNLDTTFFTPICEKGSGTLSLGVASVDKHFAPSHFSNYGNSCVGISAPGEEIIGAIPKNLAEGHVPYSINEGTSFATPIVTSAAALLRSTYPDWNAEEVYAALRMSTRPLKTIHNDGFGNGVIDFQSLLTQTRPSVEYTPSQKKERPIFQPTNKRITLPETTPQIPVTPEETVTPSSDHPSTNPEAPSRPFPDVPTTHKYALAISSLVEKNIVQGYPDGLFRPEQPINRAEFLKIIFESNGTRVQDSFSHCFPDVNSEWFAKYVCLAHLLGTVEGYPDGTFKPEKTINKAEALKILFAIYRTPLRHGLVPFIDVPNTEWYAPYIQTAVVLNVLEEVGQTRLFEPGALVTRGMMAEILYRFHMQNSQ